VETLRVEMNSGWFSGDCRKTSRIALDSDSKMDETLILGNSSMVGSSCEFAILAP
jgi:hypothetical protein